MKARLHLPTPGHLLTCHRLMAGGWLSYSKGLQEQLMAPEMDLEAQG